MRKTSLAVLCALGVTNVYSLLHKKGKMVPQRGEKEQVREIKSKIATESALSPTTNWFDATIDHFDNHGSGSATYQMRYLVDKTYYDETNGPIIFYAGNEGDIWTFLDNSGFMSTTLAEEFGAMTVWAEHRYFGESMPFGDETFDRDNLQFLTVEQAMMDYVDLIKDFKSANNMEDRAVIVGGGSYGGMLSAWLRLKYPQWFQGALAASAPILFFEGYVNPDAYDNIATDDFRKADEQCPNLIKSGFESLADLKKNSDAYQSIQEIFNLCDVPKGPAEIQSLIGTLNNSLGTMAMVDYPYPTSFVEPLPAWPVTVSCSEAASAAEAHPSGDYSSLYPIAAAGNVFYNYAGQLDCLDVSVQQGGGLDDNGWGVLACNEMVMPFASNAETSMFPPAAWSELEDSAYCEALYSLNPQYDWALEYFGGMNPKKDFMKASNIIFSNGELDPWQAGGVTFPVSDDTISLYIEHSAHHLDLRLPNAADPETVTAARQTETEWIAKWIDQYQGTNFVEQLESKNATFLA